jgi:hypothetical protein
LCWLIQLSLAFRAGSLDIGDDPASLGHARVILLKRDKIDTQLVILGHRQGHALKNDQEHPTLIPLIRIIFETK